MIKSPGQGEEPVAAENIRKQPCIRQLGSQEVVSDGRITEKKKYFSQKPWTFDARYS